MKGDELLTILAIITLSMPFVILIIDIVILSIVENYKQYKIKKEGRRKWKLKPKVIQHCLVS